MTMTTVTAISFKLPDDIEMLKKFERTKSKDWISANTTSGVSYKKTEILLFRGKDDEER